MFSLKLYMLPNLSSHIIGCDIRRPFTETTITSPSLSRSIKTCNETNLSIVEAASTDHSYLAAYYKYKENFTKFKHNLMRAITAIHSSLDSIFFIRYADHETPHTLWAAIEHDFTNQIRHTGLR
jgi:hypothetical protein